ncbi:MAG: porin family protein [Rhodomicrobium sp.]|nr:porin family protein [Rhodomicrobium sp.]
MTLKNLSFGLLGAAALLMAAPAANAADVYNKGGSLKDGPVDYIAPVAWTGFYVGVNLGGAWDDTDDFEVVGDTLLGGGHIGYNWQGPSNIVLGIEGDVSFLDDVEYLATIRGRLGYAFGPTLVYATAGGAFIGFDDDDVFGDDSGSGWVAGGGIEYKFKDNWSVGAEGLYYGFEAEDGFGDDEDANFFTARARLTYHFGPRYEALK